MVRWLAAENGFVHVCGHRGHSVAAPENTLAALRAAAAAGATTCEIDVVLTADGEIVLMHDETLDRTTDGSGLVARADLAAIRRLDAGRWMAPQFAGEPVPTLAQAIAEAARLGLGLVVEIKERRRVAALIERLAAVLDQTGGRDRVMVISFDHHQLLAVKAAIADVRTEGITHARHADIVQVARAARLDSVSIEREMWHPEDSRALHAIGVAVRCHLEPPDRLERHRALGIDLLQPIRAGLRDGLIDSLSGDDVAFLSSLVGDHPIERPLPRPT